MAVECRLGSPKETGACDNEKSTAQSAAGRETNELCDAIKQAEKYKHLKPIEQNMDVGHTDKKAVKNLQNTLKSIGFWKEDHPKKLTPKPNGNYGDFTQRMVHKFQKKYNLHGRVGPSTRALLNSEVGKLKNCDEPAKNREIILPNTPKIFAGDSLDKKSPSITKWETNGNSINIVINNGPSIKKEVYAGQKEELSANFVNIYTDLEQFKKIDQVSHIIIDKGSFTMYLKNSDRSIVFNEEGQIISAGENAGMEGFTGYLNIPVKLNTAEDLLVNCTRVEKLLTEEEGEMEE